jgi:hypothetical protein
LLVICGTSGRPWTPVPRAGPNLLLVDQRRGLSARRCELTILISTAELNVAGHHQPVADPPT